MASSGDLALFGGLTGTVFRAGADTTAAPVELKLLTVTDKTASGSNMENFSLLFRGPTEPLLEQGIYVLEHEALEAQSLFLTAIARDEGGFIMYEIVFNRFRQDSNSESGSEGKAL